MTGTAGIAPDPLRIGVLGAARIAELAIVKPARATGHRLVAVAVDLRARDEGVGDEIEIFELANDKGRFAVDR